MRAIVPKKDDLLTIESLGGTFQKPEQVHSSQLWGGSFNFTGHELDEDGGVYADQDQESLISQLNGSPAETFFQAMRHPNCGRRRR